MTRAAAGVRPTLHRLWAAAFLVALPGLLALVPSTAFAQSLSSDATLSALTVSPKDIIGFARNRTSYEVGVASTVTEATVSATARHSAATVEINPGDADNNEPGHQVSLSAGRNEVTVRVRAEDATVKIFRISVNRGVTTDFGWKAADDLDGLIAAQHLSAHGLWSDGTTMWVADNAADKLFVYLLDDGTRQQSMEFGLSSSNTSPWGIWSDKTTMWVADATDSKVYAYLLADGTRQQSEEFSFDPDNTTARGIWSDGTTMWVADETDNKLYAYLLDDGTRQESEEISLTLANVNSAGIWSDGATMWVADVADKRLYAYDLDGGTRRFRLEFPTLAATSNRTTRGVWSDGATMWVADVFDDKVYSYNMPPSADASLSALSLSRVTLDPEFDRRTTSYTASVAEIVSSTMVTAETRHASAAAVVKLGGVEDADGTVDLEAGTNTVTVEVTAEDTTTVRVYTVTVTRGATASTDASLSALSLSGVTLDTEFDAATLSYTASAPFSASSTTVTAETTDDGASAVVKLGGVEDADGTVDLEAGPNTITVEVTAEDTTTVRVYTVTVTRAATASTDATLSALTVSPKDIIGFAADRTSYEVGVASTVTEATVSATVAHSAAMVEITPGDADGNTSGHQVSLSAGRTTVRFKVTAEDSTIETYTVRIYRGRSADYGWKAADDLYELAVAGNDAPAGIWSDGTTMWVADATDDTLYAYLLADGTRQQTKEFDLHSENSSSVAMWSDDTTMWVIDATRLSVYAYLLADGTRQETKEFALQSQPLNTANRFPVGMWSDGTTVWVSDSFYDKLYAYLLVDGTRQQTKDFDLHMDNTSPKGISSDGTTVWVADSSDDKLYAYELDSGARQSGRDFALSAGTNEYPNNRPRGVWSDATTMWVADIIDDKVWSYNMPPSADASLSALSLSRVTLDPEFDRRTTSYTASVAEIVSSTMVTAETRHASAAAVVKLGGVEDADGTVDLEAGTNTITVEVTAEDTTTVRVYTVTVTREATASTDASLSALSLSGVTLDTEFDAATLSYTASVANDVSSTTVTAETADDGASSVVKLDDTLDDDGTVDLEVGPNTVTVEVTAEDTSITRTYTVTVTRAAALSTDASLSALTVSPTDVVGFAADRMSYEVGVASTVTEATGSATAGHSAAMVDILPADADTAPGHQVSLSAGRNEVTFTVTAQDSSTETYTVSVNRGVTADYGWKAADDLDGLIAAENGFPVGIWSDGTTVWVTDFTDHKFYAYSLAGGTRQTTEEFNLHADNDAPFGVWSDRATIWVADVTDNKLYAYLLAGGTRQTTDEFGLHSDNTDPTGIWSDGTTVWVADGADDKLYAYLLDGGTRQETEELDLHANNDAPNGIWSDGATIWVADVTDDKLYAYELDSGERQSARDFTTLSDAGNGASRGIWSDGTTMWVVDRSDGKVYSYNMPPSADASLSALSLSGVTLDPAFDTGTKTYTASVADSVSSTAVTAQTTHDGASAVVELGGTVDDDGTVDLAEGPNTITVVVTAEDTTTTRTYTVTVTRGMLVDYARRATADFDGLTAAGNTFPTGVWSDDTTMWVADSLGQKVYAYSLAGGARDTTKEFGLDAESGFAYGIWSDETTMWTLDVSDKKFYAYALASGARDMTKEFDLDDANGNATDIWSDGTTVWVADRSDAKLYAYALAGGARQEDDEFGLSSQNGDARGIWSDETTMWVADGGDAKVFAYALDGGERLGGRDFELVKEGGTGYVFASGMWSDGTTVWVVDSVDDVVYAYNLPSSFLSAEASLSALSLSGVTLDSVFDPGTRSYTADVPFTFTSTAVTAETTDDDATTVVELDGVEDTDATVDLEAGANTVTVVVTAPDGGTTRTYTVTVTRAQPSGDATLSALTVSPKDLAAFDADVTSYQVGAPSTAATATVSATAAHRAAMVEILPVDADDVTAGHQVSLSAGRNAVTVTVTAQDSSTETYTLSVNRGVADNYGWKAVDDLDGLASDNDGPFGMWSDGTTMWVVDFAGEKVYAYRLSDGVRETAKEFNLHSDNANATSIWSDRTTMWVTDITHDKLFAYALDGGARQTSREFDLNSRNGGAQGIWSDNTTMWVADYSGKVYAYLLAGGTRQDTKEFDLDAANDSPTDIGSDGTTMWVADRDDKKLYAYTLDGGARQSTSDFTTLDDAGNDLPAAVWTDGTTMWVSDDDKVYSYNLPPPSDDASLSALSLSGVTLDTVFDTATLSYTAAVENSVSSTEVTAATTHDGASAVVKLDGTLDDDGTVDLAEGPNTITVEVTAEDEDAMRVYTVTVDRAVPDDYSWTAAYDFNGLLMADNDFALGIWSDDTTMWVADYVDEQLYAYSLSGGARDTDKEFGLDTENDAPWGIWSDNTTVWVVDEVDAKLYAYALDGGTRQDSKDIDLHSDNGSPDGIWSDGVTIWVTDAGDNKLYAYLLAGGTRQEDDELDLHSQNATARGIWSDETTMWVADGDDAKLYAYALDDGERQGGRDFTTLVAAGNRFPSGIWSYGNTMWVVDNTEEKIFAYRMPSSFLSAEASLSALSLSGITLDSVFDPGTRSYTADVAFTVASTAVTAETTDDDATTVVELDGVEDTDATVDLAAGANTVTVVVTAADGGTTRTYTVTVTRAQPSDDATLSALTVSPKDIAAFDAAVTSYQVGAPSIATTARVSATAAHSAAMVDILPIDAATGFPGHQVSLSAGRNAVTVEVTAQDSSTKTYTLSINRGVTTAYGWKAVDDLDGLASDNDSPAGMWSDGTTMWVVDFEGDHLYAYRLSDGARQTAKEIALDDENQNATSIWSDNTTMWVADNTDDKLFAYALAGGARETAKEFSLDSQNGGPQGIWSDGATMWVADFGDEKAYAYALVGGARQDTNDFDLHTDNDYPDSMTSDGTTVWVSDRTDKKLYAYALDGGTRQSGSDFTTTALNAAGNSSPTALWTDGTTMWVSDATDDKVYSYNLPPPSDDASLSSLSLSDVTLDTAFDAATLSYTAAVLNSVSSTEVTAATAHLGASAVVRLDGTLDDDATVDLAEGPNTITVEVTAQDEVAMRTYTVTVTRAAALSTDASLSALSLSEVTLDTAFDAATLSYTASVANSVSSTTVTAATNNVGASSVVKLDGTLNDDATVDLVVGTNTVTVEVTAEDTTTMLTYTVVVTRAASSDASLSALTVSPKDIVGFAADRMSYEVGVASTVTEATVSATAGHSVAMVDILPVDADDNVPGHQVSLSAGRNEVTVTVTAQDSSTETYTVSVNRGVTDDYGWKAADDLDGLVAAENEYPTGTWSNGTTMWVADFIEGKLYAYRFADGARQETKEFNLDPENTNAKSVWSDDRTIWVADFSDSKLYAYLLDGGTRQSSKDLNLDTQNDKATGIWSDGTTMWVADSTDAKLYAYLLDGGTRQETKEFGLDSGNTAANGIWSDRATIWVADNSGAKLYAYELDSGERQSGRDFDTPDDAGNEKPRGIWSDGATMWVADSDLGKVYSYNMPPSADASLSALSLGGVTLDPAFDSGTTSYTAGVLNGVSSTMVTAQTRHDGASSVVKLDGTLDDDRTVDLEVGANTVTVEVTAEDTTTTRTYSVIVTRAAPLSTEASLSALTVSPKDVVGFAADRMSYEVGVASTVTEATVSATAGHSLAMVDILPVDADDVTAGHQVSLSAGRNEVTFTVTAQDSSTETYTVSVNRGVTVDYGWKAADDLDGLAAATSDFPWACGPTARPCGWPTLQTQGSTRISSMTGPARRPRSSTCTPTTVHLTVSGPTRRPSGWWTTPTQGCTRISSMTGPARRPRSSTCTPTTTTPRACGPTARPFGWPTL